MLIVPKIFGFIIRFWWEGTLSSKKAWEFCKQSITSPRFRFVENVTDAKLGKTSPSADVF